GPAETDVPTARRSSGSATRARHSHGFQLHPSGNRGTIRNALPGEGTRNAPRHFESKRCTGHERLVSTRLLFVRWHEPAPQESATPDPSLRPGAQKQSGFTPP